MDEEKLAASASAQETSPPAAGAEAPSTLGLLPPYVVVLFLTAVLSLVIASKGASAWHEARGSGGFPEETRREVVFALVFTYSVGVALVLAWCGELVATVVRLARRQPAARVLARLGLALLPIALFGIGHRIINPWLLELMAELRQMMVGAPG